MNRDTKHQKLLDGDLIDYQPRQWRINLPWRDYRLRAEDLVPAFAGAIGKVSLVAAFALAWAEGFGIKDPAFVTENVRLEILLASIFVIMFSVILNPASGPPGTLAPLIPLVPLMASAGVHPLPFAILISVAGFFLAWKGLFQKIINLNGVGTKAGILLLFGIMGIKTSLGNLQIWADSFGFNSLVFSLILAGVAGYLILLRFHAKWLIIPVCAVTALIISFIYGSFPVFESGIGLPVINPSFWWNEQWGIGFGLTLPNFIQVLPFVILVLTMWPIDALAVKTLQENHYPKEAKGALLDLKATFLVISLRNLVGGILGGAQTAAVWRSFMIPLSAVKRPIGGSALLLGLLGIVFGVLGFPIDIAVFPPLVWMVLIFGVFVPLLEIGFNMIRDATCAQIAVICIILGIAVNPVIGWCVALMIENFGFIPGSRGARIVSGKDRITSGVIALIAVFSYLLSVIVP